MKSIEDEVDRDYGARVLTAFRKRGLSTSQWNDATIQAMEKASRLEFLDLFKKHDKRTSYALIEVIRTASPETLVDRVTAEKKAREQMEATIQAMFTPAIY
jgi:ribosome-binding protein aMBF1 (putative translation factor)